MADERWQEIFTSYGVASDDPAELLVTLRAAAERRDLYAGAAIGWMYRTGHGVPVDLGDAERWYQWAADNGYLPARHALACMHEDAGNIVRAIGEFHTAAEAGYAPSLRELGYRYYRGEGAEKNLTRAREYFERAAAQQNVLAMTGLGRAPISGPFGLRQSSAAYVCLSGELSASPLSWQATMRASA